MPAQAAASTKTRNLLPPPVPAILGGHPIAYPIPWAGVALGDAAFTAVPSVLITCAQTAIPQLGGKNALARVGRQDDAASPKNRFFPLVKTRFLVSRRRPDERLPEK